MFLFSCEIDVQYINIICKRIIGGPFTIRTGPNSISALSVHRGRSLLAPMNDSHLHKLNPIHHDNVDSFPRYIVLKC